MHHGPFDRNLRRDRVRESPGLEWVVMATPVRDDQRPDRRAALRGSLPLRASGESSQAEQHGN